MDRERLTWGGISPFPYFGTGIVAAVLMLSAEIVRGAPVSGLLAEWNFDEEAGEVALDSSGHGHDAMLHGASRVPQGDGFALELDGIDDYVNCGTGRDIGIGGPTTIEAWIYPAAKSQGLACLFGEGLKQYLVAYYTHAELVYFYVGSGGNKVYETVNLREWNHIAATFDGSQMQLWLNGRCAATTESKFKELVSGGSFLIGTKGRPDLPKFKGRVDRLRVYNRALPGEEIVDHYKGEACGYGYAPSTFERIKATPYYYEGKNELIIEANYRGLQPLPEGTQLGITMNPADLPGEIALRPVTKTVISGTGISEARFSCDPLDPGDYKIIVTLGNKKTRFPIEELGFSYPPPIAGVPSPETKTVATLPPPAVPVPFDLRMGAGGGFTLRIRSADYPFETHVSWPHGDFNHLTAGDAAADGGENTWNATAQRKGESRYDVDAKGMFYELHRTIEVFPTHVYVKDTYTNTTDEDLGLQVFNELAIDPESITESRLGGFERGGRLEDVFCPSVFVRDANTGIGLLPIDDVFVIQSVIYNDQGTAGIGTEKLALSPGGSYRLEWAVYPAGSGDYYEFINNFRKAEDRISTIDGGLGFFTHGTKNRDQIPTAEYIESRGLKYGLMHNLAGIVDDPELSIQGVEFIDFPEERKRLRKQLDAIHAQNPDFKALIHIAHSLYCTDQPDRYPDSQVILEDGAQTIWGVPYAYISEERQNNNWKFWIYYPTPGNSFHDAMMRSVDVLRDEMHVDGGFMDGFFAGYSGRWTYDGRWDGYSAEIDPATKTITRKLGSVLLLSQQSMIEYSRKMRDRGGTIVANNTVVTRSIANEKYIIHDSESGAGPQLHLAPNMTALAMPQKSTTARGIYRNALDNLEWGELYIYYGAQTEFVEKPLPARQYPMTFEEIGAGYVKGPERIVTMVPGIYGWPGSRDLHLIYTYDARGEATRHVVVTTADADDVRSELKFAPFESAVIEPVPAVFTSETAVNLRIHRYDESGLHVTFNGKGEGRLDLRSGTFSVTTDQSYEVTIHGKATQVTAGKLGLSIPLALDGTTDVVVSF